MKEIKRDDSSSCSLKRAKKGQVTIFIILGIVIVGGAVLAYLFIPQIRSTISGTNDPRIFIESCMQEKIREVVDAVSLQGGSVDPSFYYDYQGNKVEYLCYTNKYYDTCVVQQPFLQSHIEKEIHDNIQTAANLCFEQLRETFEGKGYSFSINKGNMTVEMLPQIIAITFNHKVTLTKGDNSQSYNEFSIILNNNLYELTSIANSILEWEATYGDAETTRYMNYYHNLGVEKKKQSDGTTIYIITDLNNENKFEFASRSVAWPPGYGFSQTA